MRLICALARAHKSPKVRHIFRQKQKKPQPFQVAASTLLTGLFKQKRATFQSLLLWEQRESNPRPSACKADALNQLSYAPFLNWDCKDRCYFLFCKFYLTFLQEFDYICGPFGRGFAKVRNGIAVRTFPISVRSSVQWGCFGFDSIRHWAVSTPGSVGQPVNLDLRTISWQQLLCTRCVVC